MRNANPKTSILTVNPRTDTFARTFDFAASGHVLIRILVAIWRRTLLTCFGRVVLLANWAEIFVQGHDRIARCLAFATSIIIRPSCPNTDPHTNRNNNPNRNPQDLQLLTALHVRIACVYWCVLHVPILSGIYTKTYRVSGVCMEGHIFVSTCRNVWQYIYIYIYAAGKHMKMLTHSIAQQVFTSMSMCAKSPLEKFISPAAIMQNSVLVMLRISCRWIVCKVLLRRRWLTQWQWRKQGGDAIIIKKKITILSKSDNNLTILHHTSAKAKNTTTGFYR